MHLLALLVDVACDGQCFFFFHVFICYSSILFSVLFRDVLSHVHLLALVDVTCDGRCYLPLLQAANESAILDMEDGDDEAEDKDAGKGQKVHYSSCTNLVLSAVLHFVGFTPAVVLDCFAHNHVPH